MFMINTRVKSQAGDTIVEVMIVLAVLGSAIGLAYATANRSLLNARQAQENVEASQFVQSQIEKVRYMAPSGATNPADPNYSSPNNMYTQTQPFCVGDVGSATALTAFDTTQPVSTTNCGFGSTPYKVVVYSCNSVSSPMNTPCGTTSNNDLFIVQASWDDALGDGTDTSTISYRVHPGVQ